MHHESPSNHTLNPTDITVGLGTPEAEPAARPQIWVGSLSDYNNGILHGRWLDAAREPAAIGSDIAELLAASPWTRRSGEPAEEWAVLDTDDFGDCNFAGLTDLPLISRIAKGVAEHGLAFAAWACYVEHAERLDEFEDAYLGQWDSLHAYVEELINDLGYDELLDQALPASLRPYVKIDLAATARDLELGGDIHTVNAPNGGIWIFNG